MYAYKSRYMYAYKSRYMCAYKSRYMYAYKSPWNKAHPRPGNPSRECMNQDHAHMQQMECPRNHRHVRLGFYYFRDIDVDIHANMFMYVHIKACCMLLHACCAICMHVAHGSKWHVCMRTCMHVQAPRATQMQTEIPISCNIFFSNERCEVYPLTRAVYYMHARKVKKTPVQRVIPHVHSKRDMR